MKKVLAVFAGILMLMGCKDEQQSSFRGFEYKLLNTPVNATIAFDANEDNFFGGVVNRFFGTFTTEGNNITFGPAASTMMMGPQESMEVEYDLLRSLPEIRTFKLNGDKLIFTTEDGRTFEFNKIGEFKSNR